MHSRTHLAGPVALIAEAGSALADRVAAGLKEEGLRIIRSGPSQPTTADVVASVVLVEDVREIDALRSTLDQVLTPALILGATPELAVAILPVLRPIHDLGLATDSAAVIAWRLSSLVELSRCLAAGQSQLDALTGLLNRRAFEAQVRDVAESCGDGAVAGLLMIDLDRFKMINDLLGHVGGDSVLRAVGELLRRVRAPADLIARLGGDEFGLIVMGQDADSVIKDGERLLSEIAALDVSSVVARKTPLSLTASAGLTFIRRNATLQELMSEADVAAYEAKNDGRNRLVVYRRPTDIASRSIADLRLRHFESSTRLASQRLVEMIALRSRRLVEAAKQEAAVDALTGLHNRRFIDAQLPVEIDSAHLHGRPVSLAMLDLDDFHAVNMTYGWPTGDRVIQAFATVAQANVRPMDWVARYGGEEFVIVMPDTDRDSARQVIERVRRAFASTTIESLDGRRLRATLSAGVAQLPAGERSATEFVQRASTALRRAKNNGRNRVGQVDA